MWAPLPFVFLFYPTLPMPLVPMAKINDEISLRAPTPPQLISEKRGRSLVLPQQVNSRPPLPHLKKQVERGEAKKKKKKKRVKPAMYQLWQWSQSQSGCNYTPRFGLLWHLSRFIRCVCVCVCKKCVAHEWVWLAWHGMAWGKPY